MSYPIPSCLITWTLMQPTLRPKVLSPCCRCAGMVLVAQKMLKVKIELTWAPSLALQVCIRLVDGRHLCCYGRRQAMEPLQNIVIYLLRLVDGHFSSLFCFHNLSLCSGKSLSVIFCEAQGLLHETWVVGTAVVVVRPPGTWDNWAAQVWVQLLWSLPSWYEESDARCFPQSSEVQRSSGCRKTAWPQVAAQVALVIWNEASSTQTSAALISAMMQVKTTDAGTAFCILMVHFAGLNWVSMAEVQLTRLASMRLSWLCQVHSPFLTASVQHKCY